MWSRKLKTLAGMTAGVWMIWGLLGLVSGPSWAAQDQSRREVPPSPGCVDPTGGGGMPDPLTVYNRYVELASGELYLLEGWIRVVPEVKGAIRRTQAFMEVNLKAHPWLGSRGRRALPFYPIEGLASTWKAYENEYIQLIVRARSKVYIDAVGEPQSVISLEPLLPK